MFHNYVMIRERKRLEKYKQETRKKKRILNEEKKQTKKI